MRRRQFLLSAALVAGCKGTLCAQSAIPIPNGSFEGPSTTFVNTNIDSWQKTPQPADYHASSGYQWYQLAGVFDNTAPDQPDHIYNLDGDQAAYVFADPKVGLFQDYNSFGDDSTATSHEFNATFAVGQSFTLTVGVNGGGGNMTEGAQLLIALYYRDGQGNMVTVAGTDVVYTPAAFPVHTLMYDYQATTSLVQASDPWAGQNIGILIYSDSPDAIVPGGYWDVDNVRLYSAIPEPTSLGLMALGAASLLSQRRRGHRATWLP